MLKLKVFNIKTTVVLHTARSVLRSVAFCCDKCIQQTFAMKKTCHTWLVNECDQERIFTQIQSFCLLHRSSAFPLVLQQWNEFFFHVDVLCDSGHDNRAAWNGRTLAVCRLALQCQCATEHFYWLYGRFLQQSLSNCAWTRTTESTRSTLSTDRYKTVALHVKFGSRCLVKYCCDKWFLRASAMLKHVIDIGWTSVCPSVCLSVSPSHAGTVSKRLNILSWFLHHTIAHSF